MIHRIHTPGLLVAEAVGLSAFAEAFVRFLHGPHVAAVMNALACLLVAIYTHAVRRRVASPPPPPVDHVELARLVAAELRPARPTIFEPDALKTVAMPSGRVVATLPDDDCRATTLPMDPVVAS